MPLLEAFVRPSEPSDFDVLSRDNRLGGAAVLATVHERSWKSSHLKTWDLAEGSNLRLGLAGLPSLPREELARSMPITRTLKPAELLALFGRRLA